MGALAYTFSDTFWFSAVEGEVYAFSSFLTALVFWMILRWQDEADSVSGDRWIILIAYIIGLSIGVHLLNPDWKGNPITLTKNNTNHPPTSAIPGI